MKTGIILLAAGSSSRLGRAKQLIQIQGETLVNNAIKEAKKSKADGLVVVLGANAALIQTGFDSSSTPFIVNPDWQHGMSSSMHFPTRSIDHLKGGFRQRDRGSGIFGYFGGTGAFQ
jgi:molybdenum cofactor cytidylyltransferase